MVFFQINKKQWAVSVIIALFSITGDINSENQSNPLVAAICDNATHALIGAFTWIGTFIAKTSNADLYFIFEIFLCGLCSSIIDADHFIAARSVNLKDATSLKYRPFMHCTTLAALIVLSVLSLSYSFRVTWLYKFGWMLAVAFFSHHIRDSKRRGFWLWPFGHTAPVPFIVHLTAQMFLPQFFSVIIYKFSLPEVFRSDHLSGVENV